MLMYLDSFDPGWNDPPIFSFDKATAIQANASTRRGNLLNKRVAFPISGGTQRTVSSNPPVTGDLGRIPSNTQLLPPPPNFANINKTELPKQVDVKVVTKDKLEAVLKNLQVTTNCDEEITKRIKIMESMWVDDKLDDNVRLKIFELSEAIAKDDFDKADYIQKALMVDYVSQCSSWMSGIRHLINIKKSDKLSECDEEKTTT